MNVIDERRKLLEESDVHLLRTLVKQVVEALIGQQSDTRGMAWHLLPQLRKYSYGASLPQKKGTHGQPVAATSLLLVCIFREHIRASFFSLSVRRRRRAAGLSARYSSSRRAAVASSSAFRASSRSCGVRALS